MSPAFDLGEWFAGRIMADIERQKANERWILGEPEPTARTEPMALQVTNVSITWACPACGSVGFRKWPDTETWSCDREGCLMVATTEELEALTSRQLARAFDLHGDALRERASRALLRDQMILEGDWAGLARLERGER